MGIHREGYKILLVLTLTLGVINVGMMWGLPEQLVAQNIVMIAIEYIV